MQEEKRQRPTKDECYLEIAERLALRSTCLRRNFGAVIVNKDEVIATGYAGAPRKTINCTDVGFCYRGSVGARKGEHYELCRAVHAEQNAIIQARRLDMLGATLYLVGLDAKTKECLQDAEPCRICKRAIVNAGIEKIVVGVSKDKTKTYEVEDWVKNSLWELRKVKGRFIPVEPPPSLGDPVDEDRRDQLTKRFGLADAVVAQTTSFVNPKHTVGRAAARFFLSKVKTGNSVAISCGDTILSFIESLPYQPHRRLTIHQLSVEGDPATIHQAPSTLVGLLRGKCSPQSRVYGLQLPPLDLSSLSARLREELAESRFLGNLRSKVRRSDYVFIGVGSADKNSSSFWAVAQAASGGKFSEYVKRMGIVEEINNQVFNAAGDNCTDHVPGLSKHVVNIVTLDDIRSMAGNYPKQKVVMVATGPEKARAMRVALQTGLANVLITGREDADRLLCD